MDVKRLSEAMVSYNFRQFVSAFSFEICFKGGASDSRKITLFNDSKKAAEDAYENYKFSFPENCSNALNLTPQEIEKERHNIEFKMRLALYAAASLSMSQQKYIDKTTRTIRKRATYEEIEKRMKIASEGLGYPDLAVVVKTLIAKHNRKMPNLLTHYLEKE